MPSLLALPLAARWPHQDGLYFTLAEGILHEYGKMGAKVCSVI